MQKELEDELTRLQQEKVPFPELERVKNQIVAHKIRDLQSVSVRADMLNMFYTYFKDAERLNRDIDYYMDVNEESIMQTAQKYLNPENRVNVTFVPKTSR